MQNESGRSLLEVVGLLAIMGMIALTGVKMYRSAMTGHYANELIYEAQKRAAMVAMQLTAGRTTGSTLEFSSYSTFSGGTFDDAFEILPEGGQFKIRIRELSGDVCARMQQMVGEGTSVRAVECEPAQTGIGYIVFNQDLSAKGFCDLNEIVSDCVCPKHRTRIGGQCGACEAAEDWATWTQPLLTSNTSYGELTASSTTANGTTQCTASNGDSWCAFDGNLQGLPSKWFASGKQKATLTWHLPVKIRVSSMTFVASDVPDKRFPDTITIYGSNDGTDWQQIGAGTFYEKPAKGESRIVGCDDSAEYEYLKWELTNANRGSYTGIAFAEIQIKAKVFKMTEYDYDETTHTCVERP